ncbi:MAG: T9SS type A sorting domain-containing protein [Bacteroidota bacterium]|jgi:Secretion system C-terminal sorting domain
MKKVFLFVMMLLVFQAASRAQWSTNSFQNTPVVIAYDEQTTPKVAACDNGDTYISWFSIENANYNVRMQKFDVMGNKQWDGAGVLISSNPSMTWISDHTLTTDLTGDALISFMDIRSGYNNVYAYRIAPDGTQVWGADGIALSNGNYFEPFAKIVVPPDNQAVFAWQRADNTGVQKDVVVLQKIAPDGTLQWGVGGKVFSNSSYNYDYPDMVTSDNNSVILVYTRAISGLTAPRYIYAQRIDASGNTMWASDVAINVASGIPLGTTFSLVPDGSGGAFISWFDDRLPNHFRAYVQHLDKSGNVSMPVNGANLSTNATTQQINPSVVWVTAYNCALCFYQEEDMNQNNSGLYAQKLDLSGNIKWGANGKSYIPMTGQNIQFINGRSTDSAAIVLYSSGSNSTYWAMKVDTAGNYLWSNHTVPMSSVLTFKSFLNVGPYNNKQIIATWEDKRSDAGDIYAQNIKTNGTLGPLNVGINDNPANPAAPLSLGAVYPNPVKQKATLKFTVGIQQHVTIQVLDINGLVCKTLIDQELKPEAYTIVWDGNNAAGSRMAAGVYILRISSDSGVQTKKIVLQ